MVTERVVEVPWALAQLPHSGTILDVGSCEATYLAALATPGRTLHCIDPRPGPISLPPGAVFHEQSLFDNSLAAGAYDAVLLLSTLEHLGLPVYGQPFVRCGDVLALGEVARLLVPGGQLIATVPVGRSRLATWYRQYSPDDLRSLFRSWSVEVVYWAHELGRYVPCDEGSVVASEYRETFDHRAGAGAVAGIVARWGGTPQVS
jgi:hypothetical protein